MKKVISLLTVFSIIVTLVATVGITSVSAATTNLYDWDYYNKEDGKLYSSLSEDGKYGGKEFHVNADYTDVKTVKAFMFDSITTAKPLGRHAVTELK